MRRFLRKLRPGAIRANIDQRRELKSALFNINWLFLGRIGNMLVALGVGVWVARYLGPEQYGTMNYCVALLSLLSVFSTLGLNSVIIRDLVQEPSHEPQIMGSALLLKFVGTLIQGGAAVVLITILRPGDTEYLYFIAIVAVGYLFKVLDIIDFWFQSRLEAKYIVFSQLSSTVIVGAVKVGLILLLAPLVAFIWMAPLTMALAALGLIIFYKARTKIKRISWKPRVATIKSLGRDSWPLALSTLAVVMYMKIDQVMIGQMVDEEALGIYSVAVRLSEAWYFLPGAVAVSVFPALIRAREKSREMYLDRLQTLFDVFFWFSAVVALAIFFLSGFIVDLLYGVEYSGAAQILSLHIWSGIFVFMGMASSRYLVAENLMKISLYRTLAGVIVNFGLNLFLIPEYGGVGAAWATLISYAVSGWLANLFFSGSRHIFIMQLNSINPVSLKRYLR